jgi:hypothetical protein
MRRHLVFLTLLLLVFPATAWAGDLFLVRIVSMDKEIKQVVAEIVDGPDRVMSNQVHLESEVLTPDAQPGDLIRLWGKVSGNGNVLIVDKVVPPSRSDPTGVRRRLKNNSQTRGQGGRGKGHGRF